MDDHRYAIQLSEDNPEEEQFAAEASVYSNAFQAFEEVRSQGKLCDVTLICGESRFHAHRIVLAGTVPYFKVCCY